MTVYVDIPTEHDEFKNVAVFEGENAKEEAIKMCRERWGADYEGRVSLISIDQDLEEVTNDQIHPHSQLQD